MSIRTKFSSRAVVGCALAICLAACGGESGGSSSAAPIIIAPSPTPSPTSTPTPTPTSTPTPTGSPQEYRIANVSPGGYLPGPMVCAGGTMTYVTESDGTQRLSAVSALNDAWPNGLQTIEYVAVNRFRLDLNGFGGPTFDVADKRPSPSNGYDYFRKSDAFKTYSEFEIYRPVQGIAFATMGRFNETAASNSTLCFYAAGPMPSRLPTTNGWRYFGYADGLAVRGGKSQRLFGSEMTAELDGAKGELSIHLTLKGRDDPFGDFASKPASTITTATARLMLSSSGAGTATLTGADGSAGTITGSLFGELGVGLVFELHYPNGDRIVGAIAADMNLI